MLKTFCIIMFWKFYGALLFQSLRKHNVKDNPIVFFL